jgi:1,4-dihydroxy-2-naphthoyl-CoA hydrolase
MIWFREYTIAELNELCKNNMGEHIGIEFTEIGDNYLKASMPVDNRTKQPMGLLHGGASVALAETLGSVAATMCVNPERYSCVGLEINANHIRSVTKGLVVGTAKSIHIGKSTQVWEIKIESETGKLLCVSRITMAVINKV